MDSDESTPPLRRGRGEAGGTSGPGEDASFARLRHYLRVWHTIDPARRRAMRGLPEGGVPTKSGWGGR